ncbi:hypothetical protein HPB48_025631 [Haemaphysalis longicornis]|uniref:Serine hydroxymethyltransferase-like domain-containing protein n=1 Tax=Haemaphysalis longicornis TaxID=44386 RepID=A0A9J6HAQ8_HAELO|nr:hypothetical protein HPB48_025631 [Haemaphysalis longicornis]
MFSWQLLLGQKINPAFFILLNVVVAGIAAALKQAATPEFKAYQEQVVKNARTLAKELQAKGYTCVSGGTDNHLVWVDLRPTGLNGSRAERVLELMSIACNKNTVPGDKSALNPGGIRLGTPALTTRGLKEADIVKVADFIQKGLGLALEVKANSGPTLKDFKAKLETDPVYVQRLSQLREEVEAFALTFFMPGYEKL